MQGCRAPHGPAWTMSTTMNRMDHKLLGMCFQARFDVTRDVTAAAAVGYGRHDARIYIYIERERGREGEREQKERVFSFTAQPGAAPVCGRDAGLGPPRLLLRFAPGSPSPETGPRLPPTGARAIGPPASPPRRDL